MQMMYVFNSQYSTENSLPFNTDDVRQDLNSGAEILQLH